MVTEAEGLRWQRVKSNQTEKKKKKKKKKKKNREMKKQSCGRTICECHINGRKNGENQRFI